MQHIIEIRQKDTTDSKVVRLNDFIMSGRATSQIMPRKQVTSQLNVNDIPKTIINIMGLPWTLLPTTGYTRYKAVAGNLEIQLNLMVDELGHRFIVVYTRQMSMPNTFDSIYIGYDATLEAVNQLFAVSKIKADEWRYCI